VAPHQIFVELQGLERKAMKYIKKISGIVELRDYEDYLKENAHRFPPGAQAYVSQPYRYNLAHHRCPHDSEVSNIYIEESFPDDRRVPSRIDITIRFIGAFRDGCFCFKYENVLGYSLFHKFYHTGGGHHLVNYEEMILLDERGIHHEILLHDGSKFEISAEDVSYTWEDKYI
jgi:hypothetical protein